MENIFKVCIFFVKTDFELINAVFVNAAGLA